ncbi:porin [Hyalangium gracile]|uniref:porin n=1 Tax=Hyalangium gracile TaxID=394092 RepID=UPI001CCC1403|nr:porin [Hyalangium gracile]
MSPHREPPRTLASGCLLLVALLLVGRSASAQAPAPEPSAASAPASTPEASTDSDDSSSSDAGGEAIVIATPAGTVVVGGRLDVRENLEHPEDGIWAGELTVPTSRVEVTYRWKKRLRAVVEFDVRAELKDVFVWLKIANGFSTRAGRFKMPLSLVELESATRLPVVRRGLVRDVLDDALGLSGRSPGAQLEWKCARCTHELRFQAGVWQTREPDGKVALERGLGLMPALRGTWELGPVVVGASALFQPQGASSGGDQSSWLAALDVRHSLALASGGLRTWAEVITGRAPLTGGTGNLLTGRVVSAWRLGGTEAGGMYLEPFVMLSAMDPDRDQDADLMWESALGLNVGQWQRWRLQTQFEVRKVGTGVSAALESLEDSLASRRALLVQLEVGF